MTGLVERHLAMNMPSKEPFTNSNIKNCLEPNALLQIFIHDLGWIFACQCDQIIRLFVLYLPIYYNEKLPINVKKIAKVSSKFCQILQDPIFAKYIFFCQRGNISLKYAVTLLATVVYTPNCYHAIPGIEARKYG